MTKIWQDAWDSDNWTQGQILELDQNLGFYLEVMGCWSKAGRFPETTIEIRSEAPPTDCFTSGSMLVVSGRMKGVLEEIGAHCEFFRLKVVYREKFYEAIEYYYCNILDSVDCFDLDHGEYVLSDSPGFEDHVHRIHKLVLREDIASQYDLFRIAKGGGHIVCVSDRLADRIVERKITGIKLLTQENYGYG